MPSLQTTQSGCSRAIVVSSWRCIPYLWAITVLGISNPSAAESTPSYECIVESKYATDEHVYTQDEIQRAQFSVRIILGSSGGVTLIQRCSFASSVGRVTCDSYQADHIESDEHTGVIKFYHFRGQFDVQVYPGGFFVENNGRGGIAFGHCTDWPQ